MKNRQITLAIILSAALVGLFSYPTVAITIPISVAGSDAIFLAGRTDITIPDANQPWTSGTHLTRHGSPTPEEIKETLPPYIPVSDGDLIRAADPATGGISFYNGFGMPYFGPDGNGLTGSDLQPLDGISGYIGPQGPLTGVFLDDTIPDSGPPPATIDFTPGGLGTDFANLYPELRQVFYIGDGITGGGDYQEFYAPTGATRLFLGIPDGFGFVGAPGAYDDNDGSYRVLIGVNDIPVDPIPEPGTVVTLSVGLLGVGLVFRWRRRRKVN